MCMIYMYISIYMFPHLFHAGCQGVMPRAIGLQAEVCNTGGHASPVFDGCQPKFRDSIPYHATPYYTMLYYTLLYYTTPYYSRLNQTLPCYTIPYLSMLHYTILTYTILYSTIPYYTMLYYASGIEVGLGAADGRACF